MIDLPGFHTMPFLTEQEAFLQCRLFIAQSAIDALDTDCRITSGSEVYAVVFDLPEFESEDNQRDFDETWPSSLWPYLRNNYKRLSRDQSTVTDKMARIDRLHKEAQDLWDEIRRAADIERAAAAANIPIDETPFM